MVESVGNPVELGNTQLWNLNWVLIYIVDLNKLFIDDYFCSYNIMLIVH